MNRKIKVLQIGCENFGNGGRSVIIYNLTSMLNDATFRVDFLSTNKRVNPLFQKQLTEHGRKVVFCVIDDTIPKLKYEHKRNVTLRAVIESEQYDIVHINADDAWEACKSVRCARYAGIKSVIVHAHATSSLKHPGLIKRCILAISRLYLNHTVQYRLACSNEAGKFLFGEHAFHQGVVIKNGIDVKQFLFNERMRREIRIKLGLSNEIAFIFVGRLEQVKNPFF